jgi:putative transposase
MSRASYHTTLKELAHYGLLPPKYENIIPRTNLSRWRNESMEKFVGSEINKIADNHTELIQTLNEYPRMFYAYGKLVKTVVSIVGSANDYSKLVRSSKEKVVEAIVNAKSQVPIEKAVKLFGISTSTFYTWVSDLHHSCSNSFFKKCTRIYSNQVTPMEIKAVQKSLTNMATAHWSMKSVHFKGLREGVITVSIDTLYRLNRQLGIKEKLGRKKKKKRRKIGIRASYPNQIWHTDITVVKTSDAKKYYVYLLIDNFSRKILAYDIRAKVSGLVTSFLIQKAYGKASHLSNDLNVQLIVDGGPENNNIYVDNFVNQSQINLKKLVALRDIDFSNSMIEAVNKTLKYQYLFPDHPENLRRLHESLEYFVNDFNTIRPNGQLKGLTPDEAYEGKQLPDNFRTNILKQARLDRLAYNRENHCKICK